MSCNRPREESCDTCRWHVSGSYGTGDCRRGAPSPSETSHKWPQTRDADWCGEHEPMPEPEEEIVSQDEYNRRRIRSMNRLAEMGPVDATGEPVEANEVLLRRKAQAVQTLIKTASLSPLASKWCLVPAIDVLKSVKAGESAEFLKLLAQVFNETDTREQP
jgi:hypothetical protein